MQAVLRQMLLQSLPHPCSLLTIRHHHMRFICKQWQLLSLRQQKLWLLAKEETVEHCRQQSVEGVVKGIYRHIVMLRTKRHKALSHYLYGSMKRIVRLYFTLTGIPFSEAGVHLGILRMTRAPSLANSLANSAFSSFCLASVS